MSTAGHGVYKENLLLVHFPTKVFDNNLARLIVKERLSAIFNLIEIIRSMSLVFKIPGVVELYEEA